MLDAKTLLSMMLGGAQQGQQGPGGNVLGQMLGSLGSSAQGGSPGGAAGGLGGMLGQMLGGGQQPGQATPPLQGQTGQPGLNELLGQAQSALQSGNMGGLAETAKGLLSGNAGALMAGGLGGLLAGRVLGKGFGNLAGLALIGGLAYKAYQAYQAGQAPQQAAAQPLMAAPHGSGFADDDGDDQGRALTILRAMVAASAADGHIDDEEYGRIMGNLKQAGLADEAQAFLEHEMRHPLSAEALADLALTPEMAVQIYTAARLAIVPDQRSERVFLGGLAAAMGLEPQLVAHIDAAVSQQQA